MPVLKKTGGATSDGRPIVEAIPLGNTELQENQMVASHVEEPPDPIFSSEDKQRIESSRVKTRKSPSLRKFVPPPPGKAPDPVELEEEAIPDDPETFFEGKTGEDTKTEIERPVEAKTSGNGAFFDMLQDIHKRIEYARVWLDKDVRSKLENKEDVEDIVVVLEGMLGDKELLQKIAALKEFRVFEGKLRIMLRK